MIPKASKFYVFREVNPSKYKNLIDGHYMVYSKLYDFINNDDRNTVVTHKLWLGE